MSVIRNFFDVILVMVARTKIRLQWGRLSRLLTVIPLSIGLLLFAVLLLLQPALPVQADGPFTLDWDDPAVDWPDPSPPSHTKNQTFPIAFSGGSVTIDITVPDACISTLHASNSLDDNLMYEGNPSSEALSIIVNYGQSGCVDRFTRVEISFDHPTGVTDVTIPIRDLDEDDFQDQVTFSASDGTNTYLVNHPDSSYNIVDTSVITFDGVSTFAAIETTPNNAIDGDQNEAGVSVTFHQPNLQSVVFTYTNIQQLIDQGIGLGNIVFSADVVNLGLDKSVDPVDAAIGQIITFTIPITNDGPDDATGVVVSDTWPSGYTFISSSASQGSYDDATGQWDVGDLAYGDQAVLTISARVNATGVYTNYVEVEAADQFDIDSTPGNGTDNGEDDEALAVINVPPAAAEADLAINKVSAPNPHTAGAAITYTIVVSNYGPSAVDGVTLVDDLPTEIQNPVYSESAGTYNDTNGLWDIMLEMNDVATLTIVGTVDSTFDGQLVNTATVTSTEGIDDPNPDNNEDDDINPNQRSADLAISKVSAPNLYTSGDAITYTLVVANHGPSAVNGVTVVDNLPSQILNPVYAESTGTFTPSTGQWDVMLDVEDVVTLTIVGTVDPNFSDQLENTATVTSTEGIDDPNPDNNEDDDINTTSVLPPPPPPPAPAPPGDDDDDDDPAPTPTPTVTPAAPGSSGTPVAGLPPGTSSELPVAFLPETGLRPNQDNIRGIIFLSLAIAAVAGLAVRRIKK